MKTIVCYLFTFLAFPVFVLKGQSIEMNGEDTVSIDELPPMESDVDAALLVKPPAKVDASDGTYDHFVRIGWTALQAGTFYKVYRRPLKGDDAPIEISNGWKKSNWMFDHYQIVPGKKYLYQVVAARSANQISKPSSNDIGFASLTPMLPQALARSKVVSTIDSVMAKIYNVSTPDIYSDSVLVSYLLQNNTAQALDSVLLRLYFSVDASLDWSETDFLLWEQWLHQIQPSETIRKNLNIPITPSMADDYNLLLVSTLDGQVFSSRVTTCPVAVKKKKTKG
ncbi:MAG: hypothetical protein IPN76_26200 [Saprospiraceae bacterium]|nr:hypothetical protein [Saprospiraceae bacterium]